MLTGILSKLIISNKLCWYYLVVQFTVFLFCQAGSTRGDAYLGKLGQLENFWSLLISRIELQQIERMRYRGEADGDDNTCCICYTSEADAEFAPCSHRSCYGCITRHLLNCHRCFFCNATVLEVIKIGDNKA